MVSIASKLQIVFRLVKYIDILSKTNAIINVCIAAVCTNL